jgi:hypothetical protein
MFRSETFLRKSFSLTKWLANSIFQQTEFVSDGKSKLHNLRLLQGLGKVIQWFLALIALKSLGKLEKTSFAMQLLQREIRKGFSKGNCVENLNEKSLGK